MAVDAAKLYIGYKVVDSLKDLVVNSAQAAARFDTLGIVLDRIGKNTNYTTAEIHGFVEGLQQTGIAGIEARQVIAQMIQSNLDLSKSTQLARVAQDAAVIANLNSSETLQRMTHAIQANSVEIVRTIGLNVSFEAAVKKLATELGKTTDQLTEQEKVQARMNAIIEAGVNIQGTYEAAMTSASKQIQSFKRYVQDFEVAFGKAFDPALTQLVFGASDALKQLTETIKDPAFQRSLEDAAREIAGTLVEGMKFLISNRETIISVFKGMADAVTLTVKTVVALNRGLDEMLDKAYGIDRRSYKNKLQEDLEKNLRLLDYYEKTNVPGRSAYIEQLQQEIGLQRDKLSLLNQEKQTRVDLENQAWSYLSSGRATANVGQDLPKAVESVTKAQAGKVRQFWDVYHRTLDDEVEYEKFKLEEQRREFSAVVNDKEALARWYYAELNKLTTKGYADLMHEVDGWRSLAEIMADAQIYPSETRFKDVKASTGEYIADMKRIREEAAKIYGEGNVVSEYPAPPQVDWEQYVKPAEDYIMRHRELIGGYRSDLAKQTQKEIEAGGVVFDGWLRELANEWEESGNYLTQLSQRTAESMQDNFSDLFFDAFTGKLKDLEDYTDAVFNSILRAAADMSGQLTTQLIFGKGSVSPGGGGGAGGGLVGLIGSLVGSLGFGGGGGEAVATGLAPMSQTTAMALVRHAGGVVDGSGPLRQVPAWMVSGAPRFHNGLAPDEFVGILQRGERVLSRREARNMNTNSTTINVNVNAPNGRLDRDSLGQLQASVYATMQRAARRNT